MAQTPVQTHRHTPSDTHTHSVSSLSCSSYHMALTIASSPSIVCRSVARRQWFRLPGNRCFLFVLLEWSVEPGLLLEMVRTLSTTTCPPASKGPLLAWMMISTHTFSNWTLSKLPWTTWAELAINMWLFFIVRFDILIQFPSRAICIWFGVNNPVIIHNWLDTR